MPPKSKVNRDAIVKAGLELGRREGAESLNAGVAAGIMMYELMRDCPADE